MRAHIVSPSFFRRPAGLWRLLLTVLFCGFIATGQAAPAYAHDAVQATSPSDGETVGGLPATVSVVMDETPSPIGAKIQILDSSGTDRALGELRIDGRALVQEVDPEAPLGAYTVQWRLVSSDGHPTEGSFGFTAITGPSGTASPSAGTGASPGAEEGSGAPAVVPSADLTKPSEPAAPGESADSADSAVSVTDNGIWIIAVFAVVAVALITWLAISARRRQNQPEDRVDPGSSESGAPEEPADEPGNR